MINDSQQSKRVRLKNVLINVAFSLSVFAVLCVTTEVILRMYAYAQNGSSDLCEYNKFNKADAQGFYRFSSNPDLIIELKPGFERTAEEDVNDFGKLAIKFNQDGLREDHEYAIPKPPDTFRIAAIGDSTTFGWGVETRASWPKILEFFLQKYWPKGKHVEVINFAVPGYNGKQKLAMLEDKVPKYEPDLVIIGWLNDDDLAPAYSSLFTSTVGKFLNTHSYLFACFRRAIVTSINTLNNRPVTERYQENGSGRKISKELFDNIASFSREKNIPVLIMILPVWQTKEKNANDGFTAANHVLEELAQSSGLRSLDLLPPVEKIENSAGKPIDFYRIGPSDIWHPNAGNALVTQTIHNYLVENKLVPITLRINLNPIIDPPTN